VGFWGNTASIWGEKKRLGSGTGGGQKMKDVRGGSGSVIAKDMPGTSICRGGGGYYLSVSTYDMKAL